MAFTSGNQVVVQFTEMEKTEGRSDVYRKMMSFRA